MRNKTHEPVRLADLRRLITQPEAQEPIVAKKPRPNDDQHRRPQERRTDAQIKPLHSFAEFARHIQPAQPAIPLRFDVLLREAVHPRTGKRQWQGQYRPDGGQSIRVVCDALRERLPLEGELWEVAFHKQIPGIVFGIANCSVKRRMIVDQNHHEVVIESLECRRSYYTGLPMDRWRIVGHLDNGAIEVMIEVPQDFEIPQPGETWLVDSSKSHRSRSADRLTAVLLKRISAPAQRRVPTGDFVVTFPYDEYGDVQLQFEGWELSCKTYRAGRHWCRTLRQEGETLHIEVMRVDTTAVIEWITENLISGVGVNVHLCADEGDDDDIGGRISRVDWDCLPNNTTVALRMDVGDSFRVEIKNVRLVNGFLIGDAFWNTSSDYGAQFIVEVVSRPARL